MRLSQSTTDDDTVMEIKRERFEAHFSSALGIICNI